METPLLCGVYLLITVTLNDLTTDPLVLDAWQTYVSVSCDPALVMVIDCVFHVVESPFLVQEYDGVVPSEAHVRVIVPPSLTWPLDGDEDIVALVGATVKR